MSHDAELCDHELTASDRSRPGNAESPSSTTRPWASDAYGVERRTRWHAVTVEERDRSFADEVDFFEKRGYRLHVDTRDRSADIRKSGYQWIASKGYTHWVDVVPIANPDFVLEMYGGGHSEAEAIRAAYARWRSEQR